MFLVLWSLVSPSPSLLQIPAGSLNPTQCWYFYQKNTSSPWIFRFQISKVFNDFKLIPWTVTFKIICYQNVSFQFDNICNLWIKGLKFIGCSNNLIMLWATSQWKALPLRVRGKWNSSVDDQFNQCKYWGQPLHFKQSWQLCRSFWGS